MPTRTHLIPAELAGQRFDLSASRLLDFPRNQVTSLIKSGAIKLGSGPAKPSQLLIAGDELTYHPVKSVPQTPPAAPELPVVYEDNDLLIINKPAGIAMHPAANPKHRVPTVADFARSHTSDTDASRPGIVHRLDKDTSGLVIIAKTPAAKADLQAKFAARTIEKTYQLLVHGQPKPATAIINLPLGRSRTSASQQRVDPDGRTAQTEYRTSETFDRYSLLEGHPKTGRTHQLRVHFAAIGHPIVGDRTYGPTPPPWAKRQFLHAGRLKFVGPSGQPVDIRSQLPQDLQNMLEQARSA